MKKITKLLGRSAQMSLLALFCHTTALATTYTVNSTSDATTGSGTTGTLRYCITQANADVATPHTINFAIPGGGVQTINVGSAMTITRQMTINGFTQPGASASTAPIANRSLTLQIKPSAPGVAGVGMLVVQASNTVICGIDFITFPSGTAADAAIGHSVATTDITTGVWVWGCNFGTDATGTSTYANQGGFAFALYGNTSGVVGGTVPGGGPRSNLSGWIIGTNSDNNNDANEGNIFSQPDPNANSTAELVRFMNCDNFIIAGNYFGLQRNGVSPLQTFNASATFHWEAISMVNCTGFRIGTDGNGTSDVQERNVFAGMRGAGVAIQGNNALGTTYFNGFAPNDANYSCRPYGNNVIAGNYFGTDTTGMATNANLQNFNAVRLWTTSSNTVGGSTPVMRNVIVNSYYSGVILRGDRYLGISTASRYNTVTGNYIGVLKDGVTPSSNAIGVALNTDDGPNSNNELAGDTAAYKNTISNNIIANNRGGGIQARPIATGVLVYDNTISQNTIYNNTGLGINLGASVGDLAVTGNNGLLNAASGTTANRLMNYGIVKTATLSGNNLTISGFIGNSLAGNSAFAGATVEFFIANNSPADQNGDRFSGDGKGMAHGEGQTYLGSLTADANGLFNGTLNVGGKGVTTSTLITNTATSVSGSTSEFGVNFTAVAVAGTVVDDANGLTDGKINGTGTNAGGTLYAVLYDNTLGAVIDVVPVASDGTYSFTGAVSGEDYSVYVTASTTTKGQTAVPTVTLPNNWVTIGEVNCGTVAGCSGSDGTADSKLNLGVLSGDNTQANFGLDQRPTSNNVSQTISNPSTNAIPAGTITTNVSGTDPEQGVLTGGTIVINTLPTGGTTMSYNGTPVTAGATITNFDPTKLSYSNIPLGTISITFQYSITDSAGVSSAAPANFNVNWPTPLPLTLISFTGSRSNNGDLLNWMTAQENNTDYFGIEYSTDAHTFNEIATVTAAGNSTEKREYTYTNVNAQGNAFYRLRMVNNDGSKTYSTVIQLSDNTAATSSASLDAVYPVPFTDRLNVVINSDKDQQAALRIYNSNGSVVASFTQQVAKGGNTFELTGNLGNLTPGIYILRTTIGDKVITRELTKK